MGALTLALGAGESPLAPAVSEPWVTPDQLYGCSASDAVDLASVCAVASEILFLLSGRRFGVRTETVRPYAGQRSCGWTNVGGQVGAASSWRVQSNEGPPDWLVLKSPVQAVLQVKLDGAVLDPSAYRLFDNRKLVRMPTTLGQSTPWPTYQRLDLDDTAPGTFSVQYQWGEPVTQGAKLAAQVFACQLAKYLNRDSDCALPDRVMSVTRQGVSQTMIDPAEFQKEARTGLYAVDAWLAAVNPFSNCRRPTITSPDDIELVRPT